MELKIIHFYPDLMSLYGSYANVSVLRRYLEALGCAVTVQAVVPGEGADITGADFLFMGAGTERAQRFAAEDFARYSATVKAAAEDGTAMLFAGTAMELLGASVTDRDGDTYPGIGLASFTTVQGKRRIGRRYSPVSGGRGGLHEQVWPNPRRGGAAAHRSLSRLRQ